MSKLEGLGMRRFVTLDLRYFYSKVILELEVAEFISHEIKPTLLYFTLSLLLRFACSSLLGCIGCPAAMQQTNLVSPSFKNLPTPTFALPCFSNSSLN